ncbi:ribbon-helix-helix protein, CopG family [Candidatus Palauibacter sp.]|uniref:ribbon-helix-helix protein, CopG family n=1 Tax=Candidatus Palauibacter sp. TaxID=3101350 RepID=UPI003B02112B
MGLRTVRLDDEEEAILEDLRQKTGGSISEVLRRGLRSYNGCVNGFLLGGDPDESSGDVYRRLGLPYEDERAVAPASRASEAVVQVVRERNTR